MALTDRRGFLVTTGSALLGASAVLGSAPAARAAAGDAGATAATQKPLPPTLTTATVQTFDHVLLRWEPSATGEQAAYYRIYGDGKFLFLQHADSTFASFDPAFNGTRANAVFTVAAQDANGNVSAQSNGLVPTPGSKPDLLPPTLTSATLQTFDHVKLLWTPSASTSETRYYLIYGDGKFLFLEENTGNTEDTDDAGIDLQSEGVTAKTEFTVVAQDGEGNVSAPSNGLVAIPPKTLPAPTVTSAVINGDKITVTWTPSSTTEVSGDLFYGIIADNGGNRQGVFSVTNQTSATFDTTIVLDPITPVIVQIKEGTLMSVQASDRTGARSPLSNELPATTG